MFHSFQKQKKKENVKWSLLARFNLIFCFRPLFQCLLFVWMANGICVENFLLISECFYTSRITANRCCRLRSEMNLEQVHALE